MTDRSAAAVAFRFTTAERARLMALAARLGLRDWRSVVLAVDRGAGPELASKLWSVGDDEHRRTLLDLVDLITDSPTPTDAPRATVKRDVHPYSHLPPVRFAGALPPGTSIAVSDVLGDLVIWDGLLAVEGVRSADGRTIAPMALQWDGPDSRAHDLPEPLPLLMIGTALNPLRQGPPTRVGSIERVWRHQPDTGLPVFHVRAAGRLDRKLTGRRYSRWTVGVDLGAQPDVTTNRLTGDLTYSRGPLLGATFGPPGVYVPAWPECHIALRKAA